MADLHLAYKKRHRPIDQRFWKFVHKTESCWLWMGAKDANGYGRFSVPYSRSIPAHRMSYYLHHGSIPEWSKENNYLQLDHLCRNPSCVNPAHLEVVESRENSMRGNCPNAVNARKTHCINGHLLSDDNVYLYKAADRPNPRRNCRECKRIKDTKYREKRRCANS